MPIHCPVCRMTAGSAVAVCSSCETPHHADCWDFGGGCAVFGCGGERARLVEAATLEARAPELVHLTGREPDPEWLQRARRGEQIPRPELAGLPAPAARDHGPIVAVSWLYLAASLVLAIPATGFLVKAVTRAQPDHLVTAGLIAGAAAFIKWIGDLIAVGDPRGRDWHFCVCVAVVVASGSVALSLLLAALSVPFWSRRGKTHFGAAE